MLWTKLKVLPKPEKMEPGQMYLQIDRLDGSLLYIVTNQTVNNNKMFYTCIAVTSCSLEQYLNKTWEDVAGFLDDDRFKYVGTFPNVLIDKGTK